VSWSPFAGPEQCAPRSWSPAAAHEKRCGYSAGFLSGGAPGPPPANPAFLQNSAYSEYSVVPSPSTNSSPLAVVLTEEANPPNGALALPPQIMRNLLRMNAAQRAEIENSRSDGSSLGVTFAPDAPASVAPPFHGSYSLPRLTEWARVCSTKYEFQTGDYACRAVDLPSPALRQAGCGLWTKK
jgi:hypothetical protein